MPQHCAAYGCTTRRSVETRKEGITFHRFPPDPALRKAWETAVRKEGFCSSASTVLCSQHFKEVDIDRTGQIVRLREGVVPSVFSFQAQLQNRPAAESQASAPLDLTTEIRSNQQTRLTEKNVLTSLPSDEHSYSASSSPDTLKDKLSKTLARVEDLERQLRNAKDRQRRCKTALQRVTKVLKKKNLIIKELTQKIELDSDISQNVLSKDGQEKDKICYHLTPT